MKTAISLPDDLFRAIDARARTLKLSRSAFLALAARQLLERDALVDPTEAWNEAIDRGGQPSDDDDARAFQRQTRAVIRKSEPAWQRVEQSKKKVKRRAR